MDVSILWCLVLKPEIIMCFYFDSNGREGLLTCCIRPSSIFGPGDKLLVLSLVAAAKAGKSKVRIATYLSHFSMLCLEFLSFISAQ